MTRLPRWIVTGSACILVVGAVLLRAQSVPVASRRRPPPAARQRAQVPIDFARDIQPIFKQDLCRVPRADESPSPAAAAHARAHPQRRALRTSRDAAQERRQLAHAARTGPRRRRSDAARRRPVAGGSDRTAAGVDRSRRAHARRGSHERQCGGSERRPTRTLVVREAGAAGAPGRRAHGLATHAHRSLRAGAARA